MVQHKHMRGQIKARLPSGEFSGKMVDVISRQKR